MHTYDGSSQSRSGSSQCLHALCCRRRGSIKAGLAHIKAAIEADQAVKAGDDSRVSEALEGYRQAVELLDPAGDAIAALSQVDRDKLAQKCSQAQKRIVKLEKRLALAPGCRDLVQPGEYKLRVERRVFDGPEPTDTEKGYLLDAGEVFVLVETRADVTGTVKVRSTDGWISYLDEDGQPALVDAADADSEEASDPSAADYASEWTPTVAFAPHGASHATPIARIPSVAFTSTDSDSGPEEASAKLVPKRRGSQWINFDVDEPIADPSEVLATPEPEPEPEPAPIPVTSSLSNRNLELDPADGDWLPPTQAKGQYAPPLSPAVQRSHGGTAAAQHEKPSSMDADMWAARARALGRSASSQLDILERLTVHPRTLPPRPTIVNKAAAGEESNSLHGLSEQMERKRATAASGTAPSPVLRSETQRLGLEKRRQIRRKSPQSDLVVGDSGEAQDLTELQEWLSALHLGHLATLLFEVRMSNRISCTSKHTTSSSCIAKIVHPRRH